MLTSAQIIHVPNDRLTIQAAINASIDGDTILVAEGTYFENINFLGKAIIVASYFAIDDDETHITNTIIDGSQFNNPDSASVVTFCSGEDTTSIIKGFTIQGGKGSYHNLWSDLMYGGGIFLWNSSAKIISNIIKSNHVNHPLRRCGGAGIGAMMETGNYWVIIEENIIKNDTCTANAEYAFGGGIYTTINTTIRNNTIEENYCYNNGEQAEGGGIEVEQLPGTSISTLIDNNNIRNNRIECDKTWGAGIIVYQAGVNITNNVIQDNQNITNIHSWGAGLMCVNTIDQILVRNNLFSRNAGPTDPESISAGGGIGIRDAIDGKIIVDGNIFEYNESKHGAGFYERNSYNTHLINNFFIENAAYIGGGIGMLHGQANPGNTYPQIINNSFYGNHADESGGAIRLTGDSGEKVITFNNIFWENEALIGKDVYNNTNEDTIFVAYSNLDDNEIFGPWSGHDNINFDPFFVNPTNGDFHLDPDSPCAAKGIEVLNVMGLNCYCPSVDFENESRPMPFTCMPDMGADEVDEYTGVPIFKVPGLVFYVQCYPNPAISVANIEFTLSDAGFVTLDIHNITGRKVTTLHSGLLQEGEHDFVWDTDGMNEGMYLVRLKMNEGCENRKLLLLK